MFPGVLQMIALVVTPTVVSSLLAVRVLSAWLALRREEIFGRRVEVQVRVRRRLRLSIVIEWLGRPHRSEKAGDYE